MVRTSTARAVLFLMLIGFAVPVGAGAGSTAAPSGASKLDARLTAAVASGEENVRAILVGPEHTGVYEGSTRAQSVQRLRSSAAPFFEAVRTAVPVGVEILQEFLAAPAVLVRGPARLIQELAAIPGVGAAELDSDDSVHLYEPLPDVDIANTEGRRMLEAEDIWALGFRGEGIKVSIIDTGIDGTHEAFKRADGSSRIVAFRDFVNNQNTPYDDQGHGTHVAGTSVGSSLFVDPTFGAFQEQGVAPNASLLGAKFLNSGGSGSFANGILALQWSFDNGADITSNSWGSSCSSGGSGVMATVRQLTDLGMLSVFAAGNSGPASGTVGGPGCSASALTVGAIDRNSNIASFSSRGPCTDIEAGTPPRICPDIVAKGVAVRSSVPRSGASLGNPSGYNTLQGTSMATPHIAGAAALIEQMKRFYTGTGWDTAARAEEEVFKLTALDLGAAGEDNAFGWGLPKLLNIYALLNATDEANIVSTFGISSEVVRQGDSTVLSCTVRNLGGATATGPFLATLTDPAGGVTTLRSVTASLALLDGERVSHRFSVASNVAPGDYTFRCSFNYSWVDGNGNSQTGSVLHSDEFKVARVFIEMSLAGLAPTTTPLSPQAVTFTATNTGNEDASAVVIEVTVPDDYQFVPGANFDLMNMNTRYASPAPSSVVSDPDFGRVTLIFNVGTLAQGSTFTFTATLLPTLPGAYRTLTVAKFNDGAGKGFSQGSLTTQQVGV